MRSTNGDRTSRAIDRLRRERNLPASLLVFLELCSVRARARGHDTSKNFIQALFEIPTRPTSAQMRHPAQRHGSNTRGVLQLQRFTRSKAASVFVRQTADLLGR